MSARQKGIKIYNTESEQYQLFVGRILIARWLQTSKDQFCYRSTKNSYVIGQLRVEYNECE